MNGDLAFIISKEFYPIRFWGDTHVTLLEINGHIIYRSMSVTQS